MTAATSDPELQAELWAACAKSPLVWINLFGMTYRQHEVLPDGSQRPVAEADVPMVTWPAQDLAIERMVHAIRNGKDLLIDKSRDQGATWLCLFVFAWFFVFEANFEAKVISRKEEEVDSSERRIDMNTLMWKVRYILDFLPAWMRPEVNSSTLYLHNEANGSTIKGESTNGDVARGTRLKAILLDECSAYDNLDAIERATHRAASTRIYNSTPKGPGKYSDLRFGGRVEVVVLGFWDHPEQGANRYLKIEDGKMKWSSPWRDEQLKLYDKRTIAQNIDIDHETAGSMYFDNQVLAFQGATYAVQPPLFRGRLVCKYSGDDRDEAIRRRDRAAFRFVPDPQGPLRLWLALHNVRGVLVPKYSAARALGADISMGTGASNSSICGLDTETGEQILEWTSATADPAEFTRQAAMLGIWIIGRPSAADESLMDEIGAPVYREAILGWENNGGGGQIFTRQIQALHYENLYRDVIRGKTTRQKTESLGWNNNRASNLDQLGWLRTALGSSACIVRSPETVTELGKYVWFKSGNVGPAALENEKADAHATHGDRARALAVAWDTLLQAGRHQPIDKPAPEGSVAHHMELLDEEDGVDDDSHGPEW